MGTLPASTNASIRLALKGIYNCAGFKGTLRDNIRCLEEHGGTSGAQAHLLQDSQVNIYPHLGPQESEQPEVGLLQELEAIDLEAFVAQAVNMSRGDMMTTPSLQSRVDTPDNIRGDSPVQAGHNKELHVVGPKVWHIWSHKDTTQRPEG